MDAKCLAELFKTLSWLEHFPLDLGHPSLVPRWSPRPKGPGHFFKNDSQIALRQDCPATRQVSVVHSLG